MAPTTGTNVVAASASVASVRFATFVRAGGLTMGLRRVACGVLAGGAAVALTAPAAFAGQANGCNPGYPDDVTLTELLAAPRIVAGLAAGAYDVESLTGVFESVDENDDGVVCLKAVSNLRGSSTKSWAFFYLAADNKH
jgi:hypothetical protein